MTVLQDIATAIAALAVICVGVYRYVTLPDTSTLPKPSPKCRYCRNDYYDKWSGKSGRWLNRPTLEVVDEPEGCTITEPHSHMHCELCNARYEVQ